MKKYRLLKRPVHIEGLQHLYSVTNDGRIFSERTGKYLTLQKNKYGYPYAHMRNASLKINRAIVVHRLVAIAFIPNSGNKPQVDHIDNVKTNNHVSNLQWATGSENVKKAFALDGRKYHGKPMRFGENHQNACFSNEQIREMRRLYKSGFKQVQLASIYGKAQGHISDIVKGKLYAKV